VSLANGSLLQAWGDSFKEPTDDLQLSADCERINESTGWDRR